mmetsp:Transcript_26215/g.61688  ORF Transcript_26215/g.61688 Transcript_26215/m.61688 type:complete len:163 (+) Transcript_26215:76-564(+)
MVYELNYGTLSLVIETWELVRRIPNYGKVAGVILYQKFFKDCPKAKALFGFPPDADMDDKELLESNRFTTHAAYMIQMFEAALDMLGPDLELCTEIMKELGKKHLRYNVDDDMYRQMGEALIYAVATLLKDDFTDAAREAWREVYTDLSADMIQVKKERIEV